MDPMSSRRLLVSKGFTRFSGKPVEGWYLVNLSLGVYSPAGVAKYLPCALAHFGGDKPLEYLSRTWVASDFLQVVNRLLLFKPEFMDAVEGLHGPVPLFVADRRCNSIADLIVRKYPGKGCGVDDPLNVVVRGPFAGPPQPLK